MWNFENLCVGVTEVMLHGFDLDLYVVVLRMAIWKFGGGCTFGDILR
jgi:hypothetical protein